MTAPTDFTGRSIQAMIDDATAPIRQELERAQLERDTLKIQAEGMGRTARACTRQLAEARETNRRLNLRAQKLESHVATFVRAVGKWTLTGTAVYVPLGTLAEIAKAAGRPVDEERFELHGQRLKRIEEERDAATATIAAVRAIAESWGGEPTSPDRFLANALLAIVGPATSATTGLEEES